MNLITSLVGRNKVDSRAARRELNRRHHNFNMSIMALAGLTGLTQILFRPRWQQADFMPLARMVNSIALHEIEMRRARRSGGSAKRDRGIERAYNSSYKRSGLKHKPNLLVLDGEPNAWASDFLFPTVACLLGLKKARLNRQEMESVAAHELGHIKHGHSRRGLVTRVVLSVGGKVLVKSLSARSPMLGFALRLAMPVASRAIDSALTRNQECQADIEAALITGRPFALISGLRKMGADHASVPSWLLSHPTADQRQANLARLVRRRKPLLQRIFAP